MLLYKYALAYYEMKPIKEEDIWWKLDPSYHDSDVQLSRKLSEEHHKEYAFTKTGVGITKRHDYLIDFGDNIVPLSFEVNKESIISVKVV
jgi:hypothetical protein